MKVIKAGRPEKPKSKANIKIKKGITNNKLNFIIVLLLTNIILGSVILLQLFGILDIWLQKIL